MEPSWCPRQKLKKKGAERRLEPSWRLKERMRRAKKPENTASEGRTLPSHGSSCDRTSPRTRSSADIRMFKEARVMRNGQYVQSIGRTVRREAGWQAVRPSSPGTAGQGPCEDRCGFSAVLSHLETNWIVFFRRRVALRCCCRDHLLQD